MGHTTTGFIGDIHGDLEALEWALAQTSDSTLRVALGDMVDGRDTSACLGLLRSQGVRAVLGNHDAWAARESWLSADEREWLSGLPMTLEDLEWLACHSLFEPFDGDEVPTWIYLLSLRDIARAFDLWPHRLIVCGHAHIPAVNVLQVDGSLRYIGTDWLRADPKVPLVRGERYLVCAGCCDECVVLYQSEDEAVKFVFRPAESFEAWLARR